ncbi:selenocysteine-specific translation elongation factor [Arsenicicoccus piscis]|uniref:Tr-type G domain-containing protein n=1 Tax=Arsenicicoccus piscis TaxID=673954 RepID=A0ABQ6HN66_9MICO|nr:hypothetical protein GCM10025862_11750 [Arsenicicoccus piscis]
MLVVATAGHVDHGKSLLVRALTGMEPDRWAEERRRGMTIDLGYAWTRLPSGEQLAFVDVPGHQRFIGNMLAGVGPVPAVLLVVAADEGWRAQTQEHVAAANALGIEHGLVVVTRSDLADPAPTLADVRSRLADTSLKSLDAVCVSALTGEGMDELREALEGLIRSVPRPTTEGRVRLWIDRVFSVRGAGTVVTGTLASGTLQVGDELEVDRRLLRVKGIQSLGVEEEFVAAPARVAVNLRGSSSTTSRAGPRCCPHGAGGSPDPSTCGSPPRSRTPPSPAHAARGHAQPAGPGAFAVNGIRAADV